LKFFSLNIEILLENNLKVQKTIEAKNKKTIIKAQAFFINARVLTNQFNHKFIKNNVKERNQKMQSINIKLIRKDKKIKNIKRIHS